MREGMVPELVTRLDEATAELRILPELGAGEEEGCTNAFLSQDGQDAVARFRSRPVVEGEGDERTIGLDPVDQAAEELEPAGA